MARTYCGVLPVCDEAVDIVLAIYREQRPLPPSHGPTTTTSTLPH